MSGRRLNPVRIGAVGAAIVAAVLVASYVDQLPKWIFHLKGASSGALIWLGLSVVTLLAWQQRRTLNRAREAERAAATAEARLRDGMESISETFALWDANDRLVAHNRRYHELYRELAGIVRPGISFDELTDAYIAVDHSSSTREQRAAWVAVRRAWRRDNLGQHCEQRLPDGRWLWIADYRTAEGGIVSVQSDITVFKEREFALQASEQRYRTLTETSPIGIGQIDGKGQWQYANPALCRLLEVERPLDLLGRSWLDSVDPADRTQAARLRAPRDGPEPLTLESQLIGRSGRRHHALISGTPLHGKDPEAGALVTVLDITARKEAEHWARHLAHHDALSGLPNRVLFGDRLRQCLHAAEREHRSFAVCILDLDNFKDVNDSLGHAIGDLILQAASVRLRESTRAADTVARLSGDEFALILNRVGGPTDAEAAGTKVVLALRQPYHVEEHVLHLSASVGIALYPDHGRTAGQLLRHADMALYQAKAAGGNGLAHFEIAMSQRMSRRKQLESELRHALEHGGFQLLYQPQVELRDHAVCGAEALLRWHHREEGWVSPDEFIPVAEACGLIVPLGHWILDTVCRQARSWHEAGLPAIRMSINLSPVQIRRPELPEVVAATMQANRLDPSALELEITERMLMDDTTRTRTTLERLRALGIGLSLDDFGTGVSSLSFLKRFPIDRIKIDGSFVADIGNAAENDALVKVMISLAHSLGMQVIAEGIENRTQIEFLDAHGCDQAQGFHIGRPMSPAAFAEWVQRANAACDDLPALAKPES